MLTAVDPKQNLKPKQLDVLRRTVCRLRNLNLESRNRPLRRVSLELRKWVRTCMETNEERGTGYLGERTFPREDDDASTRRRRFVQTS